MYKEGAWERINFAASGKTIGGWIIAKAELNLDINQVDMEGTNNLVAYMCNWNGSRWKCGCRDFNCLVPYWQLQQFRFDQERCTDNDQDGYGDPASYACEEPNFDCDDNNPNISPGFSDICGNGIDEDCNGVDLVCPHECVDADWDGYDDCGPGEAGDEGNPIDCNDNDEFAYPGGNETCDTIDNNCDGQIDEGCDDDSDGYCDMSMAMYRNNFMCEHTSFEFDGQEGDDCNDINRLINPGANEICDGLDNNCDGVFDTDCDCGLGDTQVCGVNVGICRQGIRSCVNGSWGDCRGAVSAQIEICGNGIDEDCNGADLVCVVECGNQVCDGNETCSSCPRDCGECAAECIDNDDDGYIIGNSILFAQCYEDCGLDRNSVCLGYSDCDDANPHINYGATEICSNYYPNGEPVNDDCDDRANETTSSSNDVACSFQINNYTFPETELVIGESVVVNYSINILLVPLAQIELWRATYNQVSCHQSNMFGCDWSMVKSTTDILDIGTIADNPYTEEGVYWYGIHLRDIYGNWTTEGARGAIGVTVVANVETCIDRDEDGFDNCAVGAVGDDGLGIDCDDNEYWANPNGEETCDTIDNNCDGNIDEACDDDNDGYCDMAIAMYRNNPMCENTPFEFDGQEGDDCNDANKDIHPQAPELCDGLNNDCDNDTDEGCTCTNGVTQTCGTDVGECTFGIQICLNGQWGNCTGATGSQAEVCDGRDNNCNSEIDEGCDTVDPVVNSFDVDFVNNQIEVDYDVSDDQGLSRVELWRANDSGGVPDDSSWHQVQTRVVSGIVNSGTFIDIPPADTYWYGLHVVDISENLGLEPNSRQINVFYCIDRDEDGFDNCAVGAVGDDGLGIDCDDNEYWANPNGEETCDTIDNNCDGNIDEACDDDNDGYCDMAIAMYRNNFMCQNTPFPGEGEFGDDCDDTDRLINPGRGEQCDNIDNNCDGQIDEGCDMNAPVVNLFNATFVNNQVTVNYNVSDDQELARVELWRTNDISGAPDEAGWTEVSRTDISGTTYSGQLIDTPEVGVYWYGLYVTDTQGNWAAELDGSVRIQVGNGVYYIDANNGDDLNDGLTSDSPWKSLGKANSIIFNGGDTILLKRGSVWYDNFDLKKPIGGDMSLIISSYGVGDRPVINCADSIYSNFGWSAYDGEYQGQNLNLGTGVYAKQLDHKIKQLFVQGERVSISRQPNEGYYTSSAVSDIHVISSNKLTEGFDYQDANIYLRINNWYLEKKKIENYIFSTGRTEFTEPVSPIYTYGLDYGIKPGWGIFYSNHPAFIDQDYEWAQDSDNVLYIKLPSDPSAYSFAGSVRDYGLKAFWNKEGKLTFNDIQIKNANDIGIYVKTDEFNAEQVVVIKSNYIGISPRSNKINISDCQISESNSMGMSVYEADEVKINNCNLLDNSQFATQETIGQSMTGIAIYGTDKVEIVGNIIKGVGYAGISVAGALSGVKNLVIKNNIISDFCQLLNDCGGIYINGQSLSTESAVVHNNFLYDGYGNTNGTPYPDWPIANGIYLDRSASDITLLDNTIYNVRSVSGGIKVNGGNRNTLKNNIIFYSYEKGSPMSIRDRNTNPMTENIFENNIFYDDTNQESYLIKVPAGFVEQAGNPLVEFGHFADNKNFYFADNMIKYQIEGTGNILLSEFSENTLADYGLSGKGILKQNPTNEIKRISLNATYCDVDGNLVENYIMLEPFSSALLFYGPCGITSNCQDIDDDAYDNCTIGEIGDDGNIIDCDDDEYWAHPDGEETCDTVDNDCNGQTDEGCDDDVDYYCDSSLQMYRSNSMCQNTPFPGEGGYGDDCDDTDKLINPGAEEQCDDIDNNCNGSFNEGCDVIDPTVNLFNVTFANDQVIADFNVSDDKGLARVEFWRTSDVNGVLDVNDWIEVSRLSISGSVYSGQLIDTPPAGAYWYGLHAIDSSENMGIESNGSVQIIADYKNAYFVDPNSGDDNNDGLTLDSAWLTVNKAKNYVRTINQDMDKDIIVYLRGGTYELSETIEFTAADSGQNGHRIIYTAFGQELPIISGGRDVSGWTNVGGNIWRAQSPVADSRQFYVNGQRAIRARSAEIEVLSFTDNGVTVGDTFDPSRMAGAEFVHNFCWMNFRCPIESVSGNELILSNSCYDAIQPKYAEFDHCWNNESAWIENHYSLLDSPNEWYLDKTGGYLFYIPEQNESIDNAIIPGIETLVRGNGNIWTGYMENLVFNGIQFSYASWLQPNTEYGFVETQASQQYHLPQDNGPIHANIFFTSSKNIEFTNNIFSHLGAIGLALRQTAKNCNIIGNKFSDISATGVFIGDVYESHAREGAMPERISEYNEISNNYVHDTANEYSGGCGIVQGVVRYSNIIHNEIAELPYTGIHNGWGWGLWDPSIAQDNQINQNYIHDVMLTMNDGGGIYSQGSQPGTIFAENYITGLLNEPGAIYLDMGSGNIQVERNIIFDNQRTINIKGGEHAFRANYWQDRGSTLFKNAIWEADDIRIFQINEEDFDHYITNLPCEETCIFNSNTDISNINELDSQGVSIINNAGLETQYQHIKGDKTSLTPSAVLSGDFNGDEKEDKLISYRDLLEWDVILGGDYELTTWLEGWGTGHNYLVLDLNGDGLDDFILAYLDSNIGAWRWHAGISTGSSFVKESNILLDVSFPYNFVIRDYDNDTSEEIIFKDSDYECWGYNEETNQLVNENCQ